MKWKRPPEGSRFTQVQSPICTSAIALLALVTTNRTSHEVLAFHGLNGRFGFLSVRHFHKSEPPATSGLTVMDNFSTFHGTVDFKCLAQGHVIDAPGEISNENIHYDKQLMARR